MAQTRYMNDGRIILKSADGIFAVKSDSNSLAIVVDKEEGEALFAEAKIIKAYSVTECVHYEASKLIFAESASAAKVIANSDDIFDNVEYTDLRVNRAKFADGHENDSERDLWVLCIRNGWWYDTAGGHHLTSENIDIAIENGWI